MVIYPKWLVTSLDNFYGAIWVLQCAPSWYISSVILIFVLLWHNWYTWKHVVTVWRVMQVSMDCNQVSVCFDFVSEGISHICVIL